MRFLVIGASGAQGGAVARRLAADGHEVRGFSRTANVPEGVRHFPGDLGDAVRVKEAFDGVTHASVVLPMEFDPATVSAYVRHVIGGARAGGVRRLVFTTGNRLPEPRSGGETGVAAFDTRRAAAAALLDSGVPVVVLRPPLYADNLLAPWVSGPLASAGVLRYPVPARVAVPWLTHDDLGAATAAALTRDGLDGLTLDVGGPQALTGDELAAAFGPEVRYEELDVDAFESGLARMAGAPAAAGVAATYRWIRDTDGFFATAHDAGERLGVPLTPLGDWIAARGLS
ncbi:NAD-dependent epimerase/dehydratase family protein [Nonomuraea mesophila]|uniref:NAD-dependent epimerase/dehydratase family protein n=1 Tax=Nonomuraea mesophila TaxID=2530382 RepID=A0A4R5E313_9ACTN|nr:NmrA family NAD(P)-binding protein [Nonomuraea mesophila]TDE22095.1 NAD-dependent epimerase/dehydratase family protein [Nonomuraea mesophila]